VKVTVNPQPLVDAGADVEVLTGTSVRLNATGLGVVAFQWMPPTGLSCADCQSPEATVGTTTTYIVAGISAQGCRDYDTVTVNIFCNSQQVFLPNTFTPNGDGKNDVFYPRGAGISLIKSFRIYNRWGELLFERVNIEPNDETNAWDGSYKGDNPRSDVFVYVVEAVCSTGQPILIKGDVTIIR
jgi:gliding motility-associated-like protein